MMINKITTTLKKLSKDDKKAALAILQSVGFTDWKEVENATGQRQSILLDKLKEKLDCEYETVQNAHSKYMVTRAKDPMKRSVATTSFQIPGFKL